MQQWLLPAIVGALVATVAGLSAALVIVRRRTHQQVADAAVETARLNERIIDIERALSAAAPTPAAEEFVITDLGQRPAAEQPPGQALLPTVPSRIEGRLFADLVLRESVVKGASLVHGVRRALTPENRFRMRYEFRREVKRARKQRRVELRQARRALIRRRSAGEDAA